MTDEVQIMCIRKAHRNDPHERIHYVGGFHNGEHWMLSVDEAIAGIRAKTWQFWTAGGGKSVWVEIASHSGRDYLKTEADGIQPDNLLALPECP